VDLSHHSTFSNPYLNLAINSHIVVGYMADASLGGKSESGVSTRFSYLKPIHSNSWIRIHTCAVEEYKSLCPAWM